MRRLSSVDAAFWYAETHAWHMHGAGLTICDPSGVPDFCFRAVKDLVASRLPEMPELLGGRRSICLTQECDD
jgi:hypothetical protein